MLTSLPEACETQAPSPEKAKQRRLGQIAFESPVLIGGLAARMGLSCSSCHLNGRGNPDFFVFGVSDKPGRADVTSSLFSKVRGNGTFDPVVIPDIAMRDGRQIKDRSGAEFRAKVHGLVVEEFQGLEPPPYVFDAVIAYLDGLQPSACRAGEARVPVNIARDLDAAQTAYEFAASKDADTAASVFYLRVARARLERIYERYVAPDLAPQRQELLALSSRLAGMAEAVRIGGRNTSAAPDWAGLGDRLKAAAAKSLYDPDAVRAAFAQN